MSGAASDTNGDAPTPFVVLCDLDGVVWLAHQPIAGSVEAIASLRSRGHRVLFVTNNSAALVGTQEGALAKIGICAVGDVLTSARAAALLMHPGERAHVCGGAGIGEALTERGVIVAADGRVDAVVVGLHREFTYDELDVASALVRNGARLIGTNDDPTYPTPTGPIPGGGAILAAVATASGAKPVVAGKPHEPMAQLVRATVGDHAARDAWMIGDRPDTDGLFARTLGCRYAQVWSGVTHRGAGINPAPDLVDDDLAAVVARIVAPPSR